MSHNRNEDLVKLSIDARRNRVQNFSADASKFQDEAARAKIREIFGLDEGETLNFRAWRRGKEEYFEVVEDVINQTIPDAWEQSDFYKEFVESKSGTFGDKNEFVIQDKSTLIVSRFSGNHWDIDRQKLPAGKSFSLETEWYAVMVYDETERFLKGVVTLVQMYDTIQRSIQKDIDDRIYASFNGAGTYLPAQFQYTGSFDEEKLIQLADRTSVAANKNVLLAGSKTALAKLFKGKDAMYFSNEMKKELNTSGRLAYWDGLRVIEIPQSFKRGTYDFRNPDNVIYVMPENYKFIKLFFEGETRSRELDEWQNHDQTISYQLQTKVGIGVVFDSIFGTYTIE